MYNRYIPQSDGSYRRSHVPDRPQPTQTKPKPPEKIPEPCPEPLPCEPEQQHKPNKPPVCPYTKQQCVSPGHRNCQRRPPEPECQNPSNDGNILNFLKNLLPKDFDTGDLLVVLLLLLMAGDCKEDQNSALLTLVLYLFL